MRAAWYAQDGETLHGPMTIDQLQDRTSRGEISPTADVYEGQWNEEPLIVPEYSPPSRRAVVEGAADALGQTVSPTPYYESAFKRSLRDVEDDPVMMGWKFGAGFALGFVGASFVLHVMAWLLVVGMLAK